MRKRKNLIIREYLAKERTDLAVDRTFLAYLRTSMTIAVVGISLLKLFQGNLAKFTGLFLISSAIVLFIFGFFKSNLLRKKVDSRFETESATG